jgi:serine/threonine-protein kinase
MARRRSSTQGVVTCPSCGCEADPSSGAVNFCPDCGADLRPAPPADASRSAGFVHRVIADRYRLVDLVGEGGMGAVYRAEHIRMGKALALKILRGDFAQEPDAVARFLSEARIVSRLSHPHTIAVFDFGEIEGGGFYLAMEYVPGQDLATILKTGGPLPERRVAELGQQILGSLAEAHDAGIVHRDMKPGNVMVMKTRSGEDFVKVLDFGIAKLRLGPDVAGPGGPEASSTTATSAGAIVGTPSYIAPEQARGDAIDARTDLYAVGCMLYELVAGKPPFVAPTPIAVVAAHLHDEPRPLQQVVPGVSEAFAAAVHRALRKRPEDRWPSADAMREALADASEPTQTRSLAPGLDVVGGTGIASREDFRELDQHVRALRRGRTMGPVTLLAVVAALALVSWRWQDVYGLLAVRAPALARALPAALRPASVFDGEEHEPNDDPLHANGVPLPPGADGRPGGGVAEVRGSVGARLTETTGDVDIYRIDVPPLDGRKVLVAEWQGLSPDLHGPAERGRGGGEHPGEGIRGLDVMLALNRARPAGDARPAPLVATANRGGPGKPERLVAAVDAGTYYLSVREVHDEPTGPVEKPTDRYLLRVRLVDPTPGEEVEPNDGPDRSAGGPERYAEWRAAAERNPLGEGAPIRGETAVDDPDLFAVAPRADGEAPELIVAVPAPDLALEARLWIPDAEDLVRAGAGDRVRFDDGGQAPAGEPLVVPIQPRPRADAPALLELRASEGEGRYVVVALGASATSQLAVVGLARELVAAGRAPVAAQLAKVYALAFPDAPGLADVMAAGVGVDPRAVPSAAGADPGGATTADAADLGLEIGAEPAGATTAAPGAGALQPASTDGGR